MNSYYSKLYYERFFPSKKIFKWLKINSCRELSFTLENGIFTRYQTFSDYESFKKRLNDLTFEKIDIGAVYDVKPEKNKIKKAVEKELVFDVDLTDYNRTCCIDKNICERCISLIKVSVELLEYILKEELGFKKLCFVFSGRRGVHCWVTDSYASKFSEEIRGHIVSYIEKVCASCMYSDKYTEILMRYIPYLIDQGFVEKSNLTSQKFVKDKKFLQILYDKMFLKIDSEVTKSLIHLIKMPFCIHPASQMLSLPIDPGNLNDFVQNSMIKLEDLIKNPNLLNNALKILDSWIL